MAGPKFSLMCTLLDLKVHLAVFSLMGSPSLQVGLALAECLRQLGLLPPLGLEVGSHAEQQGDELKARLRAAASAQASSPLEAGASSGRQTSAEVVPDPNAHISHSLVTTHASLTSPRKLGLKGAVSKRV